VTVPVDCKSRRMLLIRSFLFRTWNQPRVGLTGGRRALRALRDAGKRTVKILGQDIGEARCPGELMQGGIEVIGLHWIGSTAANVVDIDFCLDEERRRYIKYKCGVWYGCVWRRRVESGQCKQ